VSVGVVAKFESLKIGKWKEFGTWVHRTLAWIAGGDGYLVLR
jgi:hypothetical protein